MTLHLNTFERFLMLSRIVDDVPDNGGGEAIRAMSTACMTTIRSMRGQVDDASARFAIARARDVLLLSATKSQTDIDEDAQCDPEMRYGGLRRVTLTFRADGLIDVLRERATNGETFKGCASLEDAFDVVRAGARPADVTTGGSHGE